MTPDDVLEAAAYAGRIAARCSTCGGDVHGAGHDARAGHARATGHPTDVDRDPAGRVIWHRLPDPADNVDTLERLALERLLGRRHA